MTGIITSFVSTVPNIESTSRSAEIRRLFGLQYLMASVAKKNAEDDDEENKHGKMKAYEKGMAMMKEMIAGLAKFDHNQTADVGTKIATLESEMIESARKLGGRNVEMKMQSWLHVPMRRSDRDDEY